MENDITQALRAIDEGDRAAIEKLLQLVYDELRQLAAKRLAHEQPGQTLQATALVHEAYLRLFAEPTKSKFSNRGHFFGAAAEAMRRILVDNARRKGRLKRGGSANRIDLLCSEIESPIPSGQVLALDESLVVFEQKFPEQAAIVKLRFFVGLTNEEAAEVTGISSATAHRYWTFARAWLFSELKDDE